MGQVLRFLVVGAAATTVNYSVFLIMLFGNYPYTLAMPTGFIAGTVLGYLLNNAWTFARSTATNKMARYVIVYCATLLLGFSSITILVEVAGLSPELANALTLILTTATNFLGSKYFAFRK